MSTSWFSLPQDILTTTNTRSMFATAYISTMSMASMALAVTTKEPMYVAEKDGDSTSAFEGKSQVVLCYCTSHMLGGILISLRVSQDVGRSHFRSLVMLLLQPLSM
jgi:hypothetical protein